MIEKITLAKLDSTGEEAIVIVPLFKSGAGLRGAAKKLDNACGGAIEGYLAGSQFTPDTGETLLVRVERENAPRHLLLLGYGDKSALTPQKIMRAAGNALQVLKKHRFTACSLLAAESPPRMAPEEYLFTFVKGFALAQYTYTQKLTADEAPRVAELSVMSNWDARALNRAAARAQLVVSHIEQVRDMVNMPGQGMTPVEMAKRARAFAKEHDIYCRVLNRAEIEKQKMGAVIDVGKGSAQEQRFIILHYNKSKDKLPLVCLVGKGVTFDSGGISLKPWEHMEEMKGDMAGGAIVINTVTAAARMKLPLQIVGLIPCVENMPGYNALKPGDIITTHSGKTIEVLSTDAEGRLILSDAISYAHTFEPSLIVDFATLTGACVIALGKSLAGVMGNHQRFIDLLLDAGKHAGEPAWQLPLDEDFYDRVKGDIADYKNYSGRDGSTITAAALLGKFAGDTPWLHVDIAGPFWSGGNGVSYLPKGGTGYGVDMALRFLETLARDGRARKLLKK